MKAIISLAALVLLMTLGMDRCDRSPRQATKPQAPETKPANYKILEEPKSFKELTLLCGRFAGQIVKVPLQYVGIMHEDSIDLWALKGDEGHALYYLPVSKYYSHARHRFGMDKARVLDLLQNMFYTFHIAVDDVDGECIQTVVEISK